MLNKIDLKKLLQTRTVRSVILFALAVITGFIVTHYSPMFAKKTKQPGVGSNAEACQNKTGFVICIPDGFRF